MKKQFLLYLLLPVWLGHASDQSIQLEFPAENEVRLHFVLQNWHSDTLNLPEGRFLRFSFANAHFPDPAGQPALPFQIANFGIPDGAKIHFEILSTQSFTISGVLPAPIPTFVLENGFPVEKNIPDPAAYQSWQPAGLVELVETGFLRNQPVARFRISPVQWRADHQNIQVFTQITVRVWFENMPRPTQSIPEPDESVYEQTLLNYEKSRPWRVNRQTLQKPLLSNDDPTGECLKIFIKKPGFYKVTGSELAALGVILSGIDPATLRLYNNGGQPLPQSLSASRPAGFIENAISVTGAEDGRFDAGDYFLFYGHGPERSGFDSKTRRFNHTLNPYTDANVYWLAWGSTPGKRIPLAAMNSNPGTAKTTFTDFKFVEEELLNVLQSGLAWFGRKLRAGGEPLVYTFSLKSPVKNEPVRLRAQFCMIGYGPHPVFVDFKDNRLTQFTGYGMDNDDVVYKLKYIEVEKIPDLADGLNEFKIGYLSSNVNGTCLVDWVELEYCHELIFNNEPLFFNSAPDSGLVEFRLQNLQSEPVQIFNISRFDSVVQIPCQQEDNRLRFIDSVRADAPNFYLAVAPSQFRTISNSEIVQLKNLRRQNPGADYLIIAPSQFSEAAMTLKSLRENVDSLQVQIFYIHDIFNEFGCGIPDPVALRDFLKFAFSSTPQPRYVALLGDGHYDYRGIMSTSLPNWLPPFETNENNVTASRTLDDFFAWVNGNDRLMDFAIGRLPATTSEEARQLVTKICHYESDAAQGNWRNTVAMVADDEFVKNGNVSTEDLDHTQQAEDVAALLPAGFDLRKIYMVNYPAVQNASVSGITKPQVNEDLVEQFNQGAVIFNMIGHSHERQFGHENVFSLANEVPLLENSDKLPFLIVASCAFGRFDGPAEKFIAEEMLLKPDGGVIASFASARLSFPGPNSTLNNYLIRSLFRNPVLPARLGDAVRTAKNMYQNENTEKYHLLGDPALVLKTPRHTFTIIDVNPDSLRALSQVTVTGALNVAPTETDAPKLYFKVFDSVQNLTYSATASRSVKYKMPGNVIFRGTAQVINNEFQVKFIVPKDISYGGQAGRISGYIAGNQVSAVGYRNNICLGGTDKSIRDFEGPHISIGFKNRRFQPGDIVPENPVLEVTVCDSGCGINLTGEVGHKITLVCDDQTAQKVDLTPRFNYDQDSYVQGKIEYPLSNLAPGNHRVQIKAWDNFNNSSTAEAGFVIVEAGKLVLEDVLNYPNPFCDQTVFTVNLNYSAEISIKIYSLAGRLIRQIPELTAQQGFNVLYEWDGTDAEGDRLANGVYLFLISARADAGNQILRAEAVGKLVIMH